MSENQPKILVVRLSSLGDIVLSSPVYKNLKAKWPQSHITLLVKPQFAQVLAGHPDIDEIMVAKKGLWGNIRQVRAGHFTHYLDLHSNLKSILIGFFSPLQKNYGSVLLICMPPNLSFITGVKLPIGAGCIKKWL